jgi:hypothetical protein
MNASALKPDRRSFVKTGGVCLLAFARGGAAFGQDLERRQAAMPIALPIPSKVTLLTAPLELAGDWGRMIPHSADEVVELMRHACLDDVRLVSDRQPDRLRVDEHTSGTPAIWLHSDAPTTAWIIVDTGERAWSQLAYQFGHELGHVLANSWRPDAKPRAPCQWLEEALVEAFSLRGLGRLAERWKQTPPFAGDNAYGDAIGSYRQNVIDKYGQLALGQGGTEDFHGWFANHQHEMEAGGGLNPFAQAAAVVILAEYERSPACVEAVGALNRWPERAGLSIAEYLRAWRASCRELKASPALPHYLEGILRVI